MLPNDAQITLMVLISNFLQFLSNIQSSSIHTQALQKSNFENFEFSIFSNDHRSPTEAEIESDFGNQMFEFFVQRTGTVRESLHKNVLETIFIHLNSRLKIYQLGHNFMRATLKQRDLTRFIQVEQFH